MVSNRNLLFQGSIFRGYVSFREGILQKRIHSSRPLLGQLLAKVRKICSHGASLTPLPAQETRVEHGEEEGEHHNGMNQALIFWWTENFCENVWSFEKKSTSFVSFLNLNERISKIRCRSRGWKKWLLGYWACCLVTIGNSWGFQLHTP